jgi:thiosulfate/3-mercaptopyruvate sulfurtransferase
MPYQHLISVAQLLSLQHSDPARVVLLDSSHDLFDAQAGALAYAKNHLPGAHFVSMEKEMGGVKEGNNGRNPLPKRQEALAAFRRLGINDDTQVVVYDNSQGTYASRVWWTLRWLGHDAVAVLDGGPKAWLSQGQGVTTVVPATPAMGTLTDRPSTVRVVSFEEVLANVHSQDRLVVDARSEDRFRGENETLDPVGGHIPGAVSRFYRHNLNEDGTFKTPEALKQGFAAVIGERHAEDLIMQCGSGVSACHNLLALELAGLGTAPLYVGSWSEWCSRDQAPIATGEA